jgi:hypothetical protein
MYEPQHPHDVENARSEYGHHRDDEDEEGEGIEHFHEAHDGEIHPSAVIAGEKSQNSAYNGGQRHDDNADEEGDARPISKPREGVPAEIVGAEQMPPASRRQEGVFQVHGIRVESYQRRGEYRDHDKGGQRDQAHYAQLVAGEHLEEPRRAGEYWFPFFHINRT